MSTTEPQRGDIGARIRIEELAKGRGIEGITSDEAEKLLDLSHQTASARFSDLRVDGILVAIEATRPTRRGRPARVYVHQEFMRSVTMLKPAKRMKKAKSIKKRERPIEHFSVPQLPELTPEECGFPSAETAHLPDPERPGMNRWQGHIAKYGQVHIMPLAKRLERDRNHAARRLNPALRDLQRAHAAFLREERPQRDPVEQITPDDFAEAIAAMEGGDRLRRRVEATVAEMTADAEAVWLYLGRLHTVLASLPSTTENA
jgi:hypothetical protein